MYNQTERETVFDTNTTNGTCFTTYCTQFLFYAVSFPFASCHAFLTLDHGRKRNASFASSEACRV